MDCGKSGWKPVHAALIGTLALALSACGGGGGDSGGSIPPPGTVDVTAANQHVLSRGAAVAMLGGFVGESVRIAGNGRSAGLRGDRRVALAARSGTTEASLPSLVRAATLRSLAAATGGGRERIAAIIGPTSEPCDVSGSTMNTLDDRDGSGLASAGDSLTVVFNACRDTTSEVSNGTLVVTFTELARAPLSFRTNATLTDLSIASTNSIRSATYNGGFRLSYSEPNATTSTTRVDIDNSLTARVIHPLYDDTLTLQAGYSVTLTYDSATPPGALTGGRTLSESAGRVTSRAAGGTVTVWTQPPNIDHWDVERYPRSGRVLVQGSRGSLLLTILSASSVRLELDADGDAVFESTKDVPWDSLL